MGNKTTVAINFQGLNLDTILANLKEINTLSGKVQLPKNLIDQINDLTQAVEAMKASTATLGKTKVDSKEYKEFVANITKAFNELNQRVTVLEQAMTTIGKSQDVSGIVNSINKIKDNAVEATDAINKMNETTNMVSKNKTTAKGIDIKSYQKLLDLFTKIKELEDSSIGDNSAIGKKANSMTSKTVIKNLREQLELAQDLQAELDNIYSSKKLGDGKKFFEIAEQLKSTLNIIDKLQARYESINGEGTLAKIEFAPGFKTNMDESIVDVENGFRDFIKDISKQVDIVNKKIATIPQQTKEVSKEIKQSSDSTKSEVQEGLSLGKTKYSKSKSQITIPLHLRKDEYEKFKKEIDAILEQIQDNIKPLEVRVALVSGYKTKKTEELASQLQSDLSNIDDKEIREKVSGLIDNLQKTFDTDLHMKIEVEGGKEATDIVKKVVKELKAELKKGIKSTNIDAEFGEKTLEKLNKQLSTIKPIRVNLGKDEEETGKEYAPLTLLKKTIDNIKKSITEKTDAFKEEAKTVESQVGLEVNYLTPLINSFITIKEVLSDIISLSGQIGDIKFSIDNDNLTKLVQASTFVNDAVSSVDTISKSKTSKTIKDKLQEELHSAQSGDLGDFSGLLSAEELQKELEIAKQLSSEYKEQQKVQEETVDELERGFQIIKKNLDKYGNFNLSRKKDKEWLSFWTDQYVRYQQNGGQRPISDLSDNKTALGKIQKEYQKQASKFVDEEPITFFDTGTKELVQDLKGAEKELDTFYKILIDVPQQFEEARDNLVKMIEDGLITGLDAAKKLNKEISLIKLKEEQSEKSFQEIKKTITDKGNYNLRKQQDKDELSKVISQYIEYQQKEGKHPLSDLTDNQKLLEKFNKEYEKQIANLSKEKIPTQEVAVVAEEISEASKQLDIFYKMLIAVPQQFENIRDEFVSKVENGLLSGVDAAKELNKQISLYKLNRKKPEDFETQYAKIDKQFIDYGYDPKSLDILSDNLLAFADDLKDAIDNAFNEEEKKSFIAIYEKVKNLYDQVYDSLEKIESSSQEISKETKTESTQVEEVSKFAGKTNEELQQCLATEEKWLARCKEGTKAYNSRKANIEEINALLSASATTQDKNFITPSAINEITQAESKMGNEGKEATDQISQGMQKATGSIEDAIKSLHEFNQEQKEYIEKGIAFNSGTGAYHVFNEEAKDRIDIKEDAENMMNNLYNSFLHTHGGPLGSFGTMDMSAIVEDHLFGIVKQYLLSTVNVLKLDLSKVNRDELDNIAGIYEQEYLKSFSELQKNATFGNIFQSIDDAIKFFTDDISAALENDLSPFLKDDDLPKKVIPFIKSNVEQINNNVVSYIKENWENLSNEQFFTSKHNIEQQISYELEKIFDFAPKEFLSDGFIKKVIDLFNNFQEFARAFSEDVYFEELFDIATHENKDFVKPFTDKMNTLLRNLVESIGGSLEEYTHEVFFNEIGKILSSKAERKKTSQNSNKISVSTESDSIKKQTENLKENSQEIEKNIQVRKEFKDIFKDNNITYKKFEDESLNKSFSNSFVEIRKKYNDGLLDEKQAIEEVNKAYQKLTESIKENTSVKKENSNAKPINTFSTEGKKLQQRFLDSSVPQLFDNYKKEIKSSIKNNEISNEVGKSIKNNIEQSITIVFDYIEKGLVSSLDELEKLVYSDSFSVVPQKMRDSIETWLGTEQLYRQKNPNPDFFTENTALVVKALQESIKTYKEELRLAKEQLVEDEESIKQGHRLVFWQGRLNYDSDRHAAVGIEVPLTDRVKEGKEFIALREKQIADSEAELTKKMAKTGSDSIDGLTEGIKAKEQQYFDTMEGVMQEGVNIARKTIGAESPARKYIKVSEDAVDGLIVGLKNKEEEYFTAIREIMQKATSIIQEETANIGQDVKFGEGLENANKYLQELSKTLKLLSDGKSDKRIQQIQKNLEGLKNTFANFKSRKNGLLTQIESILVKGDELKSLSNILKNSQKSIDSATKAFDKRQADNQAKAKASENLSKYEEDINKGLQEIVTKNQWTVLSSQMEPYKDGLVHVTALIKDLEGKYKELIYTTENGKVFNSESIKETDISINKKAQAFEKYQQMLERLNIGAEAIGEVTPESDNWQRLVDLMGEFGIEAENAVRIIRQVDEVGHESFQVFDALGNKKTIGVSSKDFLAIKETVNDSSKAIKEYNDLIQSLAKYSKKNFDLSNLEAQQFLDTLNKFPSAWKQIQSGVNAGSISSDDFIKLRESYNTVLKDFQNEWFSEKQLPRIRPEYISQYKELKNDLDNIILAMQNSPDFPQQDSISSLSEFINKAKEFYKIQDQINIKMTDSGTVDKLLGKIGDNLVRNSSMSRELSNNFKDLRDRIKSMRDATNGMLPTDEFNKFNAEFQELVRIMKETGQTGLGFFDLVGQKIKGISASLIAQYLSLQDWIRYFRTAFETIHQLDTALVDLKKTTTMSNNELEDFYHNSSRLAKQMGVSSQEIINQASAWSRLGYSSKEASETMAQLSSQFAKISPGTSVEDATDYLVSTMKAFNYDYTQVESEIMDSINRIGNTMATTNAEVGEMLKRSSAAMAAANNSLAETIALESAAVQITRNAETTGTAFRTISMRIRGYDEETEEVLEDYEELKGKIANLTKTAKTPGGISLFTDETKTEFKSTYQLLKEIAAIYKDLTDKDQAALLEALAGKRGGQVLAGILNDFSEVERAMKEIENSAGSADKEMGIIEESFDYKINALKETWVGFLTELADRGTLASLIDTLTKLSEVITGLLSQKGAIVGLLSVITGALATKNNVGGLKNTSPTPLLYYIV